MGNAATATARATREGRGVGDARATSRVDGFGASVRPREAGERVLGRDERLEKMRRLRRGVERARERMFKNAQTRRRRDDTRWRRTRGTRVDA